MMLASFFAAVALAGPVIVTAHDNGRTVTVAHGTSIVVRLSANPSTGYDWSLLAPLGTRVVRLVSKTYASSSTKPLPGAGGTDTWRLVAVRAGSVTLQLGYLRSWEPKKIIRRFRIVLRVT